MYETIEYFKEDGQELKDVLKSCISNYYLKYKENESLNHLQNKENNRIINIANEEVLSKKKGVRNVV